MGMRQTWRLLDFVEVRRHIWRMPCPSPGKQVARHRRAQRLTQRTLAEAAGVSTRSLQRLEAGDAGVALGTLVRTLAALGLEVHLRPRSRPTLEALAEFYGDDADEER